MVRDAWRWATLTLIVGLIAPMAACQDEPTYARTSVNDDAGGSPDTTLDVVEDTAEDVAEDVPRDVEPDITSEDAGPDSPDVADVLDPLSCALRDELDCLRLGGCVLEQSPDTGAYLCRDPLNPCEAVDGACFDDLYACEWFPGFCYCPPDVLCGCGGGPPPACRAPDQIIRCGPLALNCGAGDTCCIPDGASTGVCVTEGQCGAPIPTACDQDARVAIRLTGGLCENGACFTEIRFEPGGYVFFNDERPSTPVDARLDAASWLRVRQLLGQLAVTPLADAYGPCCNAHSDGSDAYLTLYADGHARPELRISDTAEAPAPLVELHGLLLQLGYDLFNRDGASPSIAACPGLPDVPAFDGPASTCDNAEQLAEGWISLAVEGPDAQGIAYDRYAIAGHDTLPGIEVFTGVVTAAGPNQFTLDTADTGAWTFTVRTASVPVPCVVVGQRVTATVYVEQTFAGFALELALQDDRGLLFATGAPGRLADGQRLPFLAEVADIGCAPEDIGGCGPRQTFGMTFRAPDQALTLRTSEWGRLALPGGYDLAVANLASFDAGQCDVRPSFIWAAYAIAGSDLALCPAPTPAPTVCDVAAARIAGCFDNALDPAAAGLGWPSCEGTDRCAAECAAGLSCGGLACSWNGDIDCDDIGAYGHCVATCRARTCTSDADCGLAVDCCASQYICFDTDDPPVVCDRDCDPPPPDISCTCIDGACATGRDDRNICDRALARFAECGHDLNLVAELWPAEHAALLRMQDGACSPQDACFAGCLAFGRDDVCGECHFGPALCEWDPLGECVAGCGL